MGVNRHNCHAPGDSQSMTRRVTEVCREPLRRTKTDLIQDKVFEMGVQ